MSSDQVSSLRTTNTVYNLYFLCNIFSALIEDVLLLSLNNWLYFVRFDLSVFVTFSLSLIDQVRAMPRRRAAEAQGSGAHRIAARDRRHQLAAARFPRSLRR